MRIPSNSINETSVNQNFQIRTNRTRAVKKNLSAFRVELSTRALLSAEYNNEEDTFPIHNSDALAYTKQMKIMYMNL